MKYYVVKENYKNVYYGKIIGETVVIEKYYTIGSGSTIKENKGNSVIETKIARANKEKKLVSFNSLNVAVSYCKKNANK